ERGAEALLSAGVPRIAGHVQLFYHSDIKTAVECYEAAFAFDQCKNAMNGVSVTANLFVRAELFTKVGYFDETLFSGGDIQWNRMASAMAYGITYSADSIVQHPARQSWSEI